MLIMDMFVTPQQEVPVIVTVAQTNPAKSPSEPLYGAVGVCTISPIFERLKQKTNYSSFLDDMPLYPEAAAGQLFPEASDSADMQTAIEAAKIEVVQQPHYGAMTAKGGYKYMPNEGYTGKDKAVFLVNIDGHIVKVEEFINVIDADIFSGKFEEIYKKYCPQEQWTIPSSTTKSSSAMTTKMLDKKFKPDSASFNVIFSNLLSAAVGETQGEGADAAMTLGTDASGHGRYIDFLPYLNDEFLTTSNQ